MTHKRNNILLIAGTGQNVGKTLFASKVIELVSKNKPVVSIKISPHFHKQNKNMEILLATDNFQIIKENSKEGNKDSNRFLKAGSSEVYYVQTKDSSLVEVLSYFDDILDSNTAIVCESGGLRDVIEPGLFLILNKSENKNFKPRIEKYKHLSDAWIEFDGEEFTLPAEQIIYENQKWKIQKLTQ
jgi:hypothetical protein